jgi:hypothetical protein
MVHLTAAWACEPLEAATVSEELPKRSRVNRYENSDDEASFSTGAIAGDG